MFETLVPLVCGLYGLTVFCGVIAAVDWSQAKTWYARVVFSSYLAMIADIVIGLVAAGLGYNALENLSHQIAGPWLFLPGLLGFLITKPPLKEGKPECCRRGYCGTSRCRGCCGR